MSNDVPEEEIDLEILGAFLDESEEALSDVDAQFVALEKHPEDAETLNAIFRTFHSIKGNSAFFGLMKIQRLAHQMEDLLSLMREAKIEVTRALIDQLLAGVDQLKTMLARVRQKESELEAGDEGFASLLASFRTACEAPKDHEALWPSVLDRIDAIADSATDQIAALRELRDDIHALAPKQAAGSNVDHDTDQAPLVQLCALLSPAFDDRMSDDNSQAVLQLLEALPDTVGDVGSQIAAQALADYHSMTQSVGFVPLLRETLLDKAKQLGDLRAGVNNTTCDAPPDPAGASQQAPATAKPPTQAKAESGRTMRVEEVKIDQFLDYVGELIIVREMFGNVGKRLRAGREAAHLGVEFQRSLEAFTALSHDLQHSIMEIRKLPVRAILQKTPRMVRDLAAKAGKETSVKIVGDDIAVDKSLIEAFEAPLMHMVRNAIDHGIEPPDEREHAAKNRRGSIQVTVTETADEIVFAIGDDGRGIDGAALKSKAIAAGTISESAAKKMSEQDTYQLLFAAGLSTAKEVTDVSGRGVGMDVVKRNVTKLGGKIVIASRAGEGSTFSVCLPKTVTVQILDGFLVQVGQERFVLPLGSVNESFRPDKKHVHTLAERGECITRRGRVFPLVRFSDVLQLPAQRRDPSEAIVVSVELSGNAVAAFLVDDVLGVQQVVLREIQGIAAHGTPFSGGAVLGDGQVAMVVDVERLGSLIAKEAA